MKRKIKLLGLLLSITLLTGCASSGNSSYSSTSNTSIVQISEAEQKEIVNIYVNNETVSYSTLTDMIADVKPAVVDVKTTISSSSYSSGSGVIVGKSSDGYYIITNHHVIDGGSSFTVTVYNSEISSMEYEATLIGGSPKSDIAVLKVSTNDTFKVVSFMEDSNTLKVGTDVIAIGNPLGILGGTVTKGIISALAREVTISDIGKMKLLQTDAAINSGNSGGALFNEQGMLVGIVNSGYSSYEGLNFAIPGNDARSAFTSIVNTYGNTSATYGYVEGEVRIGINVNTASIYSSSSLSSRINVVYVESVSSDSEGSKNSIYSYADFTAGSTKYFYALTKINGNDVEDATSAQNVLDSFTLGQSVSLTFKKICYSSTGGFFGQQVVYYLDSQEVNVSFNVSQYIYVI